MKTGTRPDIAVTTPKAKLRLSAQDVLADYRLAVRSRAASELSRREVLVGKAPFGISGEGKEIAQLGMAHAFRPGVGIAALPRVAGRAIGRARLLARRRGGLLRDDRERGDQRGRVLGEPERRGRPADPSGHFGVG